jgi:hypothetical protein
VQDGLALGGVEALEKAVRLGHGAHPSEDTAASGALATIGMTQTRESRVRFLATDLDSGVGGSGVCASGMSNLSRAGGIPDEARVEELDGEHRQHHDRREER